MLINIKNGDIILSECLIIKTNIKRQDLLVSGLSKYIFKKIENIDSTYFLEPLLIKDKYYMISISFNAYDKISFINLSYCKDKSIPSWKNWNLEDEINKKHINDSFLKEFFGEPPYCYSWGEISSNFNKQSSTSYITISYF